MKLHQALSILVVGVTLSACKETCPTSTVVDGKSSSTTLGSKTVPSTVTSPSTTTAKVDEKCPVPPVTPPPVEPPPVTPVPPVDPPPAQKQSYPLAWEANHPERVAWSKHAMKVIAEEVATDLLPGASDIEAFCPRYNTLDNDQRANFWALLISAMSKFESGFDPLSRYKESTMGIDPVTGAAVYSEGLLQLSYQDVHGSPFCEFDWQKDKGLTAKDPKKTILDPYKNLSCGIKILARQIRNKNTISIKSGAYWSVLVPGGRYTQVPAIVAITKKMTGCQ